MVKRQKRAPGGGRKPQGEFDELTSMFSLRMPQDIRGQLDAAAEKNGRSAAQELLARLHNSFGRERDKSRDPATRALCFLFSELQSKIAGRASRWHKDPFRFRALTLAIMGLLNELQPQGEMKRPSLALKHPWDRLSKETQAELQEKMAKTWKSPESLAAHLVSEMISQLYFNPAPDDIKKAAAEEIRAMGPFAQTILQRIERSYYGMADALRDLQLDRYKPKSK
jgi:Arc-like DNA binding domain